MNVESCECTDTYEQPKLYDRDHVLVICVNCGEVVGEELSVIGRYIALGQLFSTESTE